MRYHLCNIIPCLHTPVEKAFPKPPKSLDFIKKTKYWKRCFLAHSKTVLSPLTLTGVQHEVLVVLGADRKLVLRRVEDVEQQVTLASAAGGAKGQEVRLAEQADSQLQIITVTR